MPDPPLAAGGGALAILAEVGIVEVGDVLPHDDDAALDADDVHSREIHPSGLNEVPRSAAPQGRAPARGPEDERRERSERLIWFNPNGRR